ncbi:MAG TPA: HD domain-containing protein, partial [Armatimonadetes bacterium]|nr:HD domain-containing protein [Armatimonadota bacterium]
GQVAGVGHSADEARLAAQCARPKEKAKLRFITVDDWQDHPLLRRLRGFLKYRHADVLLVGGAVRDGLLGRPLHDFDFTVNGDATALAAAVARAFHGAFVPLDPGRNIARVVVRHAGRRFDVDFAQRQGDDWLADLQARDFTVNAIAVDLDGRYLDPLSGRDDLAAGLLRAASENAFRNDPLRTLRAVRLAAELGFTATPDTLAWIRRDAHLVPRVSGERVRDEFVRILAAPDAARHLTLLAELNLLDHVLPECAALRGVEQSPPHQWDVWTHTCTAVTAIESVLACLAGREEAPRAPPLPAWTWTSLQKRLAPLAEDLMTHLNQVLSDTRTRRQGLKLAVLLHDVGKPQTQSVGDDGRIHFYRHEQVGPELAAERLRALRFSNAEIEQVQTIVAHHMRPVHLSESKGPTRRAIYRFFKAMGDAGVEVVLLSLADQLAVYGK